VTNHWIPAPRFRGDKFTPAKAGAGMTDTYTQSSFLRKQESIATTHIIEKLQKNLKKCTIVQQKLEK